MIRTLSGASKKTSQSLNFPKLILNQSLINSSNKSMVHIATAADFTDIDAKWNAPNTDDSINDKKVNPGEKFKTDFNRFALGLIINVQQEAMWGHH